MSRVIRIRCGRCGGSGQVRLPRSLRETLALVPVAPALITTAEINLRLPTVKPTALVNRLNKLHALGLVLRHGNGGRPGYEWSRANGGAHG